MKMNDNVIEVASRGVESSVNYEIAQSSKLMDLLSNALYSNKIAAVIRELSTNAWDAHIMSGNTEQVPTMWLPSYGDLNFKLRDYGTGLTPEQMQKVYKVYGVSDKTHSNDYNGCMGLGSKSPYCYTKSFTTISYVDGIKYIYINAKGADGIPTLNLMHSESTTEPNGLEISFAINPYDYTTFATEAANIFRWFEKPFDFRMGGNTTTLNLTIDRSEFKGDNWAILNNSHNSYAVMGNVAYPIDASQIKVVYDNTTNLQPVTWYKSAIATTCHYETIVRAGIELRFDMGEVDFDVSREKLQYTEKTKKALREAIDLAYNDFQGQISSTMAACKNDWAKRKELAKWKSNRFWSIIKEMDFGVKIGRATAIENRVYNNRNYNKRRNDRAYEINADDCVVYVNDAPGRLATIKSKFDFGEKGVHVVISPKDMLKFAQEQGMAPDDFILFSSLPKAPRTSKYAAKTGDVFTLNPNGRYTGYATNFKGDWVEEEDEPEEGCYVEINRYKPEQFTTPGRVKSIIEQLKNNGFEVPPVYGIKSSAVKDYEGTLTSFHSFVKECAQKLADDKKLSRHSYKNCGMLNRLVSLIDHLPQDNELVTFLNDYATNTNGETNELVNLCVNYVKLPHIDHSTEEKNILDKFPLFSIMREYEIPEKAKEVAQYVLFCC